MNGINLNQPILYKFSSLRFFGENEHHVDRFCQDDVLLLVYDEILRFYEDGVPYEIHPGQYHVQKHNTVQAGPKASDSPKYLYVHFLAEWNTDGTGLPRSGTFEYTKLKKDIDALDALAHSDAPYILQAGKFYDLLSQLYQVKSAETTVQSIADYIERELNRKITLDMLCEEFHFSKNHIINTLKKEYVRDKNAGISPNVPENYFPNDDDTKEPLLTWRAHATLLFTNWLNYFVYQTTPYDINEIKDKKISEFM